MPRTYKRKTDIGMVPHEAMLQAVLMVIEGKSLRKVAEEKGVSKSALSRYVIKYRHDSAAVLSPNYQHSQVFSSEMENSLKEYLLTCSQMFYGLTPNNVRKLAYEMACRNGIQVPEKWNEKQLAGVDWFNCFLKRNPNLAIRNPEATSLARATAFNEHNIKAYFDILEPLIQKTNGGGRIIYNLDESGCATVQRVPRVVSQKGAKQVGQITSRERGELVTICGTVSATGVALPPVFVFPRKIYRDVYMTGAPEGSLGLVSESGWMNGTIFSKVLEHIVKFTGCTCQNQIILVMDNHESHIALDSVVYAKNNGINIVTLPPHTSNKTQPLDLSVFGPLKTYFNDEANSWMLAHPGKCVTIYQMADLIGKAWLKSATPTNIISGFKQSGIWPLDRNVFGSEMFLPSSVTDRPLPSVETMPSSSTSDVQRQSVIGTPGADNHPSTLANHREHQSTPADATPTRECVASTSGNQSAQRRISKKFVSPQEFRGYPKVINPIYLKHRPTCDGYLGYFVCILKFSCICPCI